MAWLRDSKLRQRLKREGKTPKTRLELFDSAGLPCVWNKVDQDHATPQCAEAISCPAIFVFDVFVRKLSNGLLDDSRWSRRSQSIAGTLHVYMPAKAAGSADNAPLQVFDNWVRVAEHYKMLCIDAKYCYEPAKV